MIHVEITHKYSERKCMSCGKVASVADPKFITIRFESNFINLTLCLDCFKLLYKKMSKKYWEC
jgi:uncharacterized protein YlaI